MPSPELLIPFFLATAVFACVPGPGMLYAAAQTMAGGRRAGWWSILGLHVAGYLHIAAAAFGLAALLEAVPALYATLKLAGAAYLIWLGLRFLSRPAPRVDSIPVREAGRRRPAMLDSILVEALNPKTALFYLAFLPQFTEVNAGLPLFGQVLVLGTIVNLMFSVTDVACVLLSGAIVEPLRASPVADRFARRVGGGILIGLGVELAVSRN